MVRGAPLAERMWQRFSTADLVLSDPMTVADLSTYGDPHRYASGIIHLFVAGRPVLFDGKLTGKRPGRVLRKVPL